MNGLENNTSGMKQHLYKALSGLNNAHIVYMYNEYEQYVENALTFISEGLDRGEKIILAESKEFFGTIFNKLLNKGYSKEDLRSIITLSNIDVYKSQREFKAEYSLNQLMKSLKPLIDKNMPTRTWGEVLFHPSEISELRIYESECDKFISGKNLISVCTYNALTTPSFIQNELLKIHEYVMVDNQIVYSPFYNKRYLKDISHLERERLKRLEIENSLLKEKNEKLLIDTARQKDRENYLQLAKVNAEKANDAKNLFLSQMSHDLRTPLNTIQGYSQIILMDEYDQELQKKINKIFQASEDLLKLIEQILDFNVMTNGEVNIEKEKVHLKPFLENCISSILELNHTNISIQLEGIENHVYIEVDPLRFKQIIMNLLNNAIKYNTLNGKIKVYCNYTESNEDIKINIEDTGVGISNNEQELIFEPFYRSKSSTKGTGLGLAIVAQLTKRMGGNYGVSSQEGVGSTFWVSFKRVEHSDLNAKEILENPNKKVSFLNSPIKVLYIEDNHDNIDVMTSMFNIITNIDLRCALTGETGIREAFDFCPDLILLDLSLPDINIKDVKV
ncbi:ATP-binding protein [Cytobacillus sp. FJAT-54145]|uniref:histidine kinase n=1 Tax=Cytobacillus spartinae TaxID=3299023 RepID=A0ABW6K6Z9_9BACI